MNKIALIIKREYLTRVKKRSFMVMTFLGPILMAAIWIVPFYLSTIDTDTKVVAVLDESHLFDNAFKGDEKLKFIRALPDLEMAKQNLLEAENYALLYVPLPEAN
ncbi:MAG: ABC transporter permease, partial [Bacteroidia bacterium]